MPVKLEGFDGAMCTVLSADVESLVREVKDRLCLKNKERYRAFRASPYSTKRGPCGGGGVSTLGLKTCGRFCSTASSCLSSTKCGGRRLWGGVGAHRDEEGEHESARLMLQQLLREQTLIQEAVRRLQRRGSEEEDEEDGDGTDSDCESVCRTPVLPSRPQRSRNISESAGSDLSDDILNIDGVD